MWKRLLCTAFLACASFGAWAASSAPDIYPSKPIRLIVGFPPGGADDAVARVIAPKIAERLGQTVIVDNRPGAAGNVGTEIAARANADGYTLLLMGSITLASSPGLYPRLGYDALRDFSHISFVGSFPQVLVAHPSVPSRSFPAFVALARSKPKESRYGSGGVASTGNLAMELLQRVAGIELLHVPYKGAGPALIGVAGGETQIAFAGTGGAIPLIKAKRLNALAVTSAKRSAAAPEVPTVAESGFPGFNVTNTLGILAPTGASAKVVKLINSELRSIVQMEDVKEKLAAQGVDAVGSTPAEFRSFVAAELSQWSRVIKDARITVN